MNHPDAETILSRPPVRRLPRWRAFLCVGSIIAGALLMTLSPLIGIPLFLGGIVLGLFNIVHAPSRQMILVSYANRRVGRPGAVLGFLADADARRARNREIDRRLIEARRRRNS